MAAKSSAYASITQKVICLLFLQSGLSLSQATTSSTVRGNITIHPTASITSGNHSMTSGSSNTTSGSLNATAFISSGNFSATNNTVVPSPSASTVVLGQPHSVQGQRNFKRPTFEEFEQIFKSEALKLNHAFSSEIDPKSDESIDVNVIDSFTKMMTSGRNLLFRYNASVYYETVDYFNVTESLVIIMRKYYCVEEREAVLPDRSSKSTRKELGKVTDTVALKFDCPRTIINDTRPRRSHSRKRREVEMDITMEINADDDSEEHKELYQYHQSRFRRNAAENQQQQCGPLKCNVKRFESNLKIVNKEFTSALKDLSSSEYQTLTDELTTALRRVLRASAVRLEVEKIVILKYAGHSQSNNVDVRFYLDVHDVQRKNVTDANVTYVLKQATTNYGFQPLEVESNSIALTHVVVLDGTYQEWTKWGKCDSNYDTNRTRECKGARNGGQCHGHASEKKKCDCVFNVTGGGNISSPLFPKNYSTEVNCVWFLSAPVNHTVNFSLNEFVLEKDKKCFYDYLEFYDGDNVTSEDHLIDNRMCGNHAPRIIQSKGRMLSIVFNSDKSVTGKGFFGVWHSVERVEKGFVPQYVTALTMIYSPNINDTHYPLGKATTCSSESITMDENCKFNANVYIISRLISAQMGRRLPLTGENRIIINFEHIMNEKLFPAMYSGQKYCVYWNNKVYWNSDAKLATKDKGSWSRTGCSLVSTNLTHSSCACDREGLFALLGQEKTHSGKLKLLTNTYIGIGISYFILILAIIHIVWKVEIHGGEVMRINMCAAIIAMQAFFLIGAHVTAQQTLCGFLAFAIYFSVLGEFSWLLLHGLRIQGKIKKIFASNLNIEIVYVVIGWGLPLLLALLAIGVKIDSESKDKVCWEAAAGSSMLGYAAPLILISLFNGAVLVKLLIPTQDVRDAYDHRELRFRVFKDFVFLLCFTLTCTFAYQAVEEKRFFEQYLLTAFLIMQAVAMFVFGREGRKDFIKRALEPKPEPETGKEEWEENIYENIYENIQPATKPSKEADLGEGSSKKRPRKRASNKEPEKITVSTLKNLNIYKESGQYVIEA